MSEAFLEVVDGVTTVVVGPPGSGKTDLIRSRWIEIERNAAYQPQRPHLFRGLMGTNLGLGLSAEQCGLAGQYARRLGLESLLAEPSLAATDDERSRLTLARTLARPEALVILDEPLGSIAPQWRTSVISVIRDALTGRTALIATADADLAATVADRLAIVTGGSVATQGLVADVVESEWWPIG